MFKNPFFDYAFCYVVELPPCVVEQSGTRWLGSRPTFDPDFVPWLLAFCLFHMIHMWPESLLAKSHNMFQYVLQSFRYTHISHLFPSLPSPPFIIFLLYILSSTAQVRRWWQLLLLISIDYSHYSHSTKALPTILWILWQRRHCG